MSNGSTSGGRRGTRRGGARLIGVIALVAAIGAAVAVYAMRSADAGTDKQETRELHRVARSSFDITVTANGELEAKRQTEIRSKLESPAAIVEVAAEGTRVKKDDLLVKLNSENIETQRQEQLLRVESARSELTAAENDFHIQENENDAAKRQSTLKMEIAVIELRKWLEGDDKKRRAELAISIESADRDLVLRTDAAAETRKLFEKGFASKDELLTDEKTLAEAEARAKTTQLDKLVYEEFEVEKQMKKLSSDVDEAKAELERVIKKSESQIAIKDANRINKRRQLELVEEKLAKLEEQIANSTIVAPTDGLVVYATSTGRGRGFIMMGGDTIQIGKNVQPNELIIILPETGQMVASVRVHESLAGSLRPGQKANIRIEAVGNQTFEGAVESIGVLAETDGWRDPNLREYTVKIDLLNGSGGPQELKPSMRCEAEVTLGGVKDALAVPVQAVFRDGAVAFVYTPTGGKYTRTPINVGRRSSTLASVRDYPEGFAALAQEAGIRTLKEGDQVLLREPAPGEVLSSKFSDKLIAALTPQMPAGMPGGARVMQAAGGAPGGNGPTTFVAGSDGKAPAGAPQGMPAVQQGQGQAQGGETRTIRMDDKQAQEWMKKAREGGMTVQRPPGTAPGTPGSGPGTTPGTAPSGAPAPAEGAKPEGGGAGASPPAKPDATPERPAAEKPAPAEKPAGGSR